MRACPSCWSRPMRRRSSAAWRPIRATTTARRAKASSTGRRGARARSRSSRRTLDARRRCRGRSRHRGGVRGHGGQARRVRASSTASPSRARCSRPTPRRSTSIGSPARRRGRSDVLGLHFFSPANVMRLLEVVRGARTSAGRARHRDEAREADRQDRGRVGRVRRLHRQPDGRALPAPGGVPGRGGRDAGRGRRARSSASAWRWGRSG